MNFLDQGLSVLNANFTGSSLSGLLDFHTLGWFLFMLTLCIYIISKDQWVRLRKELHQYAMFDLLTGLPNRRMFEEQIDHSIRLGQRRGEPFVLILGDLNHFKTVNDTLGHHAGDELLKEVACRLNALTRSGDISARLGGDEFAFIIHNAKDPDSIAQVCARITQVMNEPVIVGRRSLKLGISLGVALYPTDGDSITDLLRRADLAMYKAKETRSHYVVYHPELDIAEAFPEFDLELPA